MLYVCALAALMIQLALYGPKILQFANKALHLYATNQDSESICGDAALLAAFALLRLSARSKNSSLIAQVSMILQAAWVVVKFVKCIC